MNRTFRVAFLMLALLWCFTLPVYGWNNRGHMMVAAVAYQRLDQPTKNRVYSLLLLNPDVGEWFELIPAGTSDKNRRMMIFMIAATWPDRIKGNPDYFTDGPSNGNLPPTDGTANNNIGYDDLARHKYWHFVDVPFTSDNSELPELVTPNAQTRINDFRAVLSSTTSSKRLKSYDLSWLLHLVGDIHQPLHCTTRVSSDHPEGDAGGNLVFLNGSPSNLHSFWDGILGGGASSDPVAAKAAAATLPLPSPAAVNDLNIQHWVNDGFSDAKIFAYKNPPIGLDSGPFSPTVAYRNAAKNLARKRIALAGARLAKILNEELE
jgi:hypothetical protein